MRSRGVTGVKEAQETHKDDTPKSLSPLKSCVVGDARLDAPPTREGERGVGVCVCERKKLSSFTASLESIEMKE